MKNLINLLLLSIVTAVFISCEKSDDNDENNSTLSGDVSEMSQVGTVVTSSGTTIAGISNFSASVMSLADGVSSYSGTAVVTDDVTKNILSNLPEISISGDLVTLTGFKVRQTVEGIECKDDIGPGIVVKYSSNVGDTYPVGTTGRTRTVVYKSTTDDFYYGGLNIKVIKVEEPTPALKSIGISKVTYWANHRFGLVSVKYDLSDGSSATFPLYSSTTN